MKKIICTLIFLLLTNFPEFALVDMMTNLFVNKDSNKTFGHPSRLEGIIMLLTEEYISSTLLTLP